jgi:hypothetical protein
MPAVSRSQRIAMVLALKHPDELYARNRGLAKMSGTQLQEFARTPEKNLPMHVKMAKALTGGK